MYKNDINEDVINYFWTLDSTSLIIRYKPYTQFITIMKIKVYGQLILFDTQGRKNALVLSLETKGQYLSLTGHIFLFLDWDLLHCINTKGLQPNPC